MIRITLTTQPIAAVQRSAAPLAVIDRIATPVATLARSSRPMATIAVPLFPAELTADWITMNGDFVAMDGERIVL